MAKSTATGLVRLHKNECPCAQVRLLVMHCGGFAVQSGLLTRGACVVQLQGLGLQGQVREAQEPEESLSCLHSHEYMQASEQMRFCCMNETNGSGSCRHGIQAKPKTLYQQKLTPVVSGHTRLPQSPDQGQLPVHHRCTASPVQDRRPVHHGYTKLVQRPESKGIQGNAHRQKQTPGSADAGVQSQGQSSQDRGHSVQPRPCMLEVSR